MVGRCCLIMVQDEDWHLVTLQAGGEAYGLLPCCTFPTIASYLLGAQNLQSTHQATHSLIRAANLTALTHSHRSLLPTGLPMDVHNSLTPLPRAHSTELRTLPHTATAPLRLRECQPEQGPG